MKTARSSSRSLPKICPGNSTLLGFLVGFGLFVAFAATGTLLNTANADIPGVFQLQLLARSLTGIRFWSRNPAATPNLSDRIPGLLPLLPTETACHPDNSSSLEGSDKHRQKTLLTLWDDFLNEETAPATSDGNLHATVNTASYWVPRPPHLENCSEMVERYQLLDQRERDGSLPSWSLWKGKLRNLERHASNNFSDHGNQGELILFDSADSMRSRGPPWIEGTDADNLPMTREVQQDLWVHQHPRNCSDPQLRFLWAVWDNRKGLGLGALITAMAGFLSIAIRENRILVTDGFSRAEHAGCVGAVHAQWDCYFLPETCAECKTRALELLSSRDALKKGIITRNRNYNTKEIWFGMVPGRWGSPWHHMQPTSEIDRKLLVHHLAEDRRWWRAQAVRYLMRFPSGYACGLMNRARHQSFGAQAAELLSKSLPNSWPEETAESDVVEGEMERYVWRSERAWIPRPMISVHVRQGDKAAEMKMVGFEAYMQLAHRVRSRFPDAENIWLSTEMQDVIEESKTYKAWKFYYTGIARQSGATSMGAYEASLGKEASTNNAIVNFLMASHANFFVGALGSTWCSLIDGMRSTSGKVKVGYLSVNKDRFW